MLSKQRKVLLTNALTGASTSADDKASMSPGTTPSAKDGSVSPACTKIFSAAFNYEGDTIITGSKDNTCRIWKC